MLRTGNFPEVSLEKDVQEICSKFAGELEIVLHVIKRLYLFILNYRYFDLYSFNLNSDC